MLVSYVRTALALKLHTLKVDRRAVTAIEYALIAALIAVVIIGAVSLIGTGVCKHLQQRGFRALSPAPRRGGCENGRGTAAAVFRLAADWVQGQELCQVWQCRPETEMEPGTNFDKIRCFSCMLPTT